MKNNNRNTPATSTEKTFQKGKGQIAEIVGVIACPEDVRFAARHPDAADFYEIRLDKFRIAPWVRDVINVLRKRGKKIILTVRDWREGGAKKHWSFRNRMRVLKAHLDLGDVIDIEAANLGKFKKLIKKAVEQFRIRLLASFHSMLFYPAYSKMEKAFRAAEKAKASFMKIVVRLEDIGMLFRFKEDMDALSPNFPSLQAVPMGTGALGASSRIAFSRITPLLYGYLAKAVAPGQPQVDDLRAKLQKIALTVAV